MSGRNAPAPFPIARWLVIAVAALLAACGANDGSPTAPASASGPGGVAYAKPGTPQQVFLSMTVNDSAQYQVHSDGGGPYINGVDSTHAWIDGNGNLHIGQDNFNGTAPPRRTLLSDFSQQVGGPAWSPTILPQSAFRILTNHNANGSPNIQDLAVGTASCFSFTIAFGSQLVNGGAGDYFAPVVAPGSGWIRIARTDVGTWVATSDGCSPNTGIAAVPEPAPPYKGKAPPTVYGYYLQRLSLTLTAIP